MEYSSFEESFVDPSEERQRLLELYSAMTTWLGDHTPLNPNSSEPLETHKGLLLSTGDVVDYSHEIYGVVVRHVDPRAADDLHITDRDIITFCYVPSQYSRDELEEEPELVPTFCSIAISDVADVQGEVELCFGVDEEKPDWKSNRTNHTEMTATELRALQHLAQQLTVLEAEMQARKLGPESMEVYHQEARVAKEVAALISDAESAALEVTEERLAGVRTQGEVSEQTLERLLYIDTKSGMTFSNIPRNEIGQLRIHIANAMLDAQVAMQVFDQNVAQRISPVFHDAERANRTIVTAATLSARASTAGPVFVYTVTKDVVLKDGVRREEIESFLFHDSRYIRLLTFYESLGRRPTTIQVDRERPMTRRQYSVFGRLASLITPASATQ